MRVIIKKKNLEITPALSDFLEKKIIKTIEERMKKISSDLPLLELEVGRSTQHHHKGRVYHAEANLSLGGEFFRAEVDDDDLHKACDLLKDELTREIIKFKSKRSDVSKRKARKTKEIFNNPDN